MNTMTEQSDRELLELAANAFWRQDLADDEVSLRYSEQDEGMLYLHAENQDHNGHDREFVWNPLTDDGDAFRLAGKLRISIEHPDPRDLGGGYVTASIRPAQAARRWFNVTPCSDECPGDLFEATRRAIVRAAASIGASK
jgi:hypothetical protein